MTQLASKLVFKKRSQRNESTFDAEIDSFKEQGRWLDVHTKLFNISSLFEIACFHKHILLIVNSLQSYYFCLCRIINKLSSDWRLITGSLSRALHTFARLCCRLFSFDLSFLLCNLISSNVVTLWLLREMYSLLFLRHFIESRRGLSHSQSCLR